jgi:hypothetical protein
VSLPPETTLDDVLVRIHEAYTKANPSVGKVSQVVLKEGPRSFRIASLMEILDRSTSELHHYSLKIDQINHTKRGWFAKPERSIRLDGDSPDEIERLYRFLHAKTEGALTHEPGELHVIRSEDYVQLESLLKALPDIAHSDKIQFLCALIEQLDRSEFAANDLVTAFEGSPAETISHIAAASRFVQYREAYFNLKQLVEEPSTPEHEFQRLLADSPWMFGSEYSELLPRRTWTRDDNLDFMLRRTVDGFLQIVEIKTAFAEPLLLHDRSHDSYHPSAKLSKVVGQVIRYIEEVERSRDSIIASDQVDPLKIRALVIIGRDGDAPHQAALRNLNGHLHGIEIITYDQLLRIADRVLGIFHGMVPPTEDELEEIPF